MNCQHIFIINRLSRIYGSKLINFNTYSSRHYSGFINCPVILINRYRNNPILVNCDKQIVKRHLSNVGGTFNDSVFYQLSGSQAVSYVQKFLLQVHDTTGLPWWATIALSTLMLRGVMSFPLAVYQNYVSAKVENISLIDMPIIAKEVKDRITKKAMESKWTAKEASYNYKYELKKEWDSLIVAQNCHPVKATLPVWFQIPTWICFSTALRNLSYMMPLNDTDAQIRFMELSFGGFLWVPNLVVPDTTFILPILLGMSNLVIIEIQCLMRMKEATRAQRYLTNFFRFFSIILVPISATVPSCVCLYWTVSSLLGLSQNLILMSNRVRSMFGIPDTPSTLDKPYTHLVQEIAHKLRLQ